MIRKVVSACLVAAALSSFGAGASAATITRTYHVEATDFFNLLGGSQSAPTDPVVLDFTVTFDPSSSVAASSAGLTVNALNVAGASEFAYNAPDDMITIGSEIYDSGQQSGEGFGNSGSDYGLFLGGATSATPFAEIFEYGDANDNFFASTSLSVTASPIVTAAVPEPASWALTLAGFGAVGAAMRRRSRVVLA
jgi:hypothetical protein